MFGDLADKLVQDSRRTANLERLPLYQSDLVRAVTRETRELGRLVAEDNAPADNRVAQAAAFVYDLCMRRNKRCLLAYHFLRTQRLDLLVWSEQAEPLSGGQSNENDEQGNLSAAEQVYLRDFGDLVIDYKGEWTDIDLTGSLDPPREMYVEVRVLKDAGEIQTEYGVFNLTKDSQFFARQADVQRLVQQGLVQQL